MSSGKCWSLLCPTHLEEKMVEADPGETHAMFSTASSGYFAPEHPGRISPNAIHPTRPATAAFRDGSRKGSLAAYSKLWPKTSKSVGR
jgi:hypothetical protein